MSEFGTELKRLRLEAGLRQIDLVTQLGQVIARSTLAGVESGRELPSIKLWSALREVRPEWTETLRPLYEHSREQPVTSAGGSLSSLAGPFSLVEARYVYIFRDGPAPEEIIEVRQVRALKDGADSYVLRMATDGPESELDAEVLWGGTLGQSVVKHDLGQTVILHRLDFDHPVRKGEVYSFGLRSRVTKEEDPPTSVELNYTIPVSLASLHLNFRGPSPRQAWRFGPLADAWLAEAPEVMHAGQLQLRQGSVSAYFRNPSLNAEYGIAWAW